MTRTEQSQWKAKLRKAGLAEPNATFRAIRAAVYATIPGTQRPKNIDDLLRTGYRAAIRAIRTFQRTS